MEMAEAQVPESGRTDYCNLALWIRCKKNALSPEMKTESTQT